MSGFGAGERPTPRPPGPPVPRPPGPPVPRPPLPAPPASAYQGSQRSRDHGVPADGAQDGGAPAGADPSGDAPADHNGADHNGADHDAAGDNPPGGPGDDATTGHPAVDAAMAKLAEVDDLPAREQVAAYGEAHRALQATLNAIEER